MTVLDKQYPIDPHPTWDVTDSSKMQVYMTCPRKYFYQYVLGWTSEEPNKHLVFGEAWHRAMEVLLTDGYTPEAVNKAYSEFEKIYREHYPEIMDSVNAPKDPGNALIALSEYAKQYRSEKEKVHYIEVAGTVPVNEVRVMHFKIDSVLENERGFFSREHKTTGRNSAQFRDQWSLKTQIGTYYHALNCLYGPENVHGIQINGAVLRKSGNEFVRIPVRKSVEQMNDWLWHINHYLDRLEWDFEELSKSGADEDVLYAFPKNTESCFKYGKCDFFEFCMSRPNPLKNEGEPPTGYKREFWDPRNLEEEAQYKAELSTDPSKSTVEKKERKEVPEREERRQETKEEQETLDKLAKQFKAKYKGGENE